MNFLDFVGYDVLLKVLRHILSISSGIGLYFFVHWLLNDKNKRGS